MGVSVFIQNQIHEKIAEVAGYASNTLDDVISQAPAGSLTRGINRHADTMFNTTQLNLFIDEIASFVPGNDSERELFKVLRDAAESAIRQRGYLWFSGD
ncbi:hypothetical protein F3087_12930 [Nocardia colli]|uniref:Uncharacterized protein n=1 Tax=Nocardia colli TaxID=2545717 RepID=A0A5N0EF01_9NOCA|nr:hypothetical protein [Nocardia colli]KAA8887982.1 hypothetical protein F3087_12930 [Nocardia colli]